MSRDLRRIPVRRIPGGFMYELGKDPFGREHWATILPKQGRVIIKRFRSGLALGIVKDIAAFRIKEFKNPII